MRDPGGSDVSGRLRWLLLILLVVAIWLVLNGDLPAHAPARPAADDIEGRAVPAEAAHLVDLEEFIPDLILDIRYARDDNTFERVLYPVARALCARGTAVKLARAQQALAASGFRLILWDSYRPESVQRQMWAMVPDSSTWAFSTGWPWLSARVTVKWPGPTAGGLGSRANDMVTFWAGLGPLMPQPARMMARLKPSQKIRGITEDLL